MKPLIIFLITLIGHSSITFGQKEASNWYFGLGAGITFNNGAPVALTGGAISQSEGVATISDANGALLFYTDGNKVWDRSHAVMSNGSDLNGDNQSAQSAVIIPMPNNPDLYYVFTVSNWPKTDVTAGLFYSVIDMRLNGGMGDVTTKNFLLNSNPREQVTAAFHANCRDVWIVSHEKGNTNNYLSYLLSPTGVNAIPVISPVGMLYNGGNRYGYLRFSSDGKKLCSTLGYAITGPSTVITVQVLDFNKATGAISNPMTLADANFMRDAYCSEFSPDNNMLYVTTYNSRFLYQYDLSLGTQAAITSNVVNVGLGSDVKTGVQLGPDKKIYVSKSGKSFLAVIDNPNQVGSACMYVDDAISLGTGVATLGLPNFNAGFFDRPNLGADRGICTGGTMSLNAYTKPGDTYLWQDGSINPSINVTAPGTYWVEVASGTCVKRDEINIVAGTPPVLNLGPDRNICGTTIHRLNAYMPDATYLWDDGAISPIYSVSAPGTYTVMVTQYGCVSTESVTVTAIAPPTVNLGNDTVVCGAPSLVLDAGNTPGNTYLWNSGATTSTYKAVTAGTFSVTVRNTGCSATDAITVGIRPVPLNDLGPDADLCTPGPAVTLNAKTTPTAVYQWQDGSTAQTHSVSAPGLYWLKITDKGCSKSDTITFTGVAAPVLELGNDTAICNGTPLKLDAYTAAGNTYIWQNGNADSAIMVIAPGKYWVDVMNTSCLVSDTITVTAAAAMMVNLGKDTTICNPASITLTAPASATGTYQWHDLTTGTSFTTNASGKYWVTVNENGCAGSDTIFVTSVAPPVVNLGNDTALCVGDRLPLTASSAPGNNYKWQNGTITTAFTVSTPGKYYVDVTNAACKTTDTINVTYRALPQVSAGNDTLICANGTVLLTASTSSMSGSYSWQDGSTGNTYSAPSPGSYWVALTDNGCVGKDSVRVSLMPSINIGRDTSLCVNQTLLLSATAIPGATYNWQDGTALPSYRVLQPGTYQVDVTTACGVQSDAIVVKEEDCKCRIAYPNAFSPDRNYHNDVFKPVMEYCTFAEYNFKIFNRWGERVFETNNPLKGWDGLHKGLPGDTGLYIYVVTYRSTIAADKKVKQGTMMLVR